MWGVAAFEVAKALEIHSICCSLFSIHQKGTVGQMDRWTGSLHATVPCFLETGPYTTRKPRPGAGAGGLLLMVELSLKLLSPLLLVPVSQASLPLNPQSAPNDPLPWGDS